MDKLLLRPEEAARALGIGRTTVYELMATSDFPSLTIGRARRIPADDLRAWITAQREAQQRNARAQHHAEPVA